MGDLRSLTVEQLLDVLHNGKVSLETQDDLLVLKDALQQRVKRGRGRPRSIQPHANLKWPTPELFIKELHQALRLAHKRPYELTEVAGLLGVHRATVRTHLKVHFDIDNWDELLALLMP